VPIIALLLGGVNSPNPTPSNPNNTSVLDRSIDGAMASASSATAVSVMPITVGSREPNLSVIVPASGAITPSATGIGVNNTPASAGVRPRMRSR
jgi:hypothetical protein